MAGKHIMDPPVLEMAQKVVESVENISILVTFV